MALQIEQGTTEKELKFLFNILDTDQDGYLNPIDVESLFQKCGRQESSITWDCIEVIAQVKHVEVNSDGLIDYESFRNFHRRMDKFSKLYFKDLDEKFKWYTDPERK